MLAAMIEIVALTPDDWRTWRQLRLAALAEAPEAFSSRLADWQGAGDAEARWRKRLRDVAFNVVAYADGAAAGMASGADHGEVVSLISLWVLPAARGQGVGDALVGRIVAWAAAMGRARVELDVRATNATALGLYRRCGFAVARTRAGEPAEVRMVRPLGRARPSPGDVEASPAAVGRDAMVAGFGNPLRADEGLGPRLIERLAARQARSGRPAAVTYLDLGTSGMRLLDVIDGAPKAVIIHCARMGRPPGDIVRFTLAQVRARKVVPVHSLHGGDLLDVLTLAERLRVMPPEVVLFGVEPASLAYGRALSAELERRLPDYVATIEAEVGDAH